MKVLLKPIFEMITGEYRVFDNILYNYIALSIIGIFAFFIAWNIVGKLYSSNFISGKNSGSIIHWIIRLVVFTIVFYIFVLISWIIKNIITFLCILAIILAIVLSVKYLIKKKKAYIEYLDKEIYDFFNRLSANLNKEKASTMEMIYNRGLNNSGTKYTLLNNLINGKFKDATNNSSQIFKNANNEFNYYLNNKEYEDYCEKCTNKFNDIADKFYEEINNKDDICNNDGMKEQLEIWKCSLKQNVSGNVRGEFEKIKLIKTGRKIEKIAICGLILSIISMIEGAVSIYLAVK